MKLHLPEGKTQKELIELFKNELEESKNHFFGKHMKINGRITTGMALFAGHYLAHICKSVSIFDPKENEYITVIKH